jgi:hypothetical protein
MDGQMATAQSGFRGLMMAGVDEAHDRHSPPGIFHHVLKQSPSISTGTDQKDSDP